VRRMVDRVERWFPWVFGLAGFGVALLCRARGWDASLATQFDLGLAMTTIFNVIAFATPLTVALFAITLAPGGGFIQKLFGTKTYSMFVGYVIVALVLGLIALASTAPFLVAKVGSASATGLTLAVPVWWGISCAALAGIGRVMFIFLWWARSYAKPKQVSESQKFPHGVLKA